MAKKIQSTNLNRMFSQGFDRLELWAVNPWRRYSMLLIVLLLGFFLGSSIGAINGVLGLMDPIGAFLAVLVIEIMVRLRRNWSYQNRNMLSLSIIDFSRIGFSYGLLLEGFKLL